MSAKIPELVASHPLLARLPGDAVAQVAGCARIVAFVPAELLLAKGDHADTLFLVRRGRVAVEIHAPDRGPIGRTFTIKTKRDFRPWPIPNRN